MEELNKIEEELNSLLNVNYKESQEKYWDLSSSIKMIIRRVYPELERERKIKDVFPIGISFSNMTEEQKQKYFISDIKQVLRGLKTIKQEYELFGFDDFTPLKEKTETEVQLGSDKLGALWRRKKTN